MDDWTEGAWAIEFLKVMAVTSEIEALAPTCKHEPKRSMTYRRRNIIYWKVSYLPLVGKDQTPMPHCVERQL